ncbi:MAG: hypothetical protein HY696_05950 [Deltaproteobacteria bacterium]|nr:hypothetical protein [Deltaproteobacteria bacterium]
MGNIRVFRNGVHAVHAARTRRSEGVGTAVAPNPRGSHFTMLASPSGRRSVGRAAARPVDPIAIGLTRWAALVCLAGIGCTITTSSSHGSFLMENGVVKEDSGDKEYSDSEFGSYTFRQKFGEATLSVDLHCESDAEAQNRFRQALEATCSQWLFLADNPVRCVAHHYASTIRGKCGR